MTLPTSGPISLSQVNTELGRASNAAVSLGETAVRALAGVSSGAISMSNLRGKAALTDPVLTNKTIYSSDATGAGASVSLTLQTNGVLVAVGSTSGGGSYAPQWAGQVLTSGQAANYEVYWTLVAGYVTPTTSIPQNTWTGLGSGAAFSLSYPGGSGGTSNFTLQIRRIGGATVSAAISLSANSTIPGDPGGGGA